MKRVAVCFLIILAVFGLFVFYLCRSEDAGQAPASTPVGNATEIVRPEKYTQATSAQSLVRVQNDSSHATDYHEVALKLLQNAREGNGQSQFELFKLIGHCYHAVSIKDIDARDTAKQYLSHQLSDAERNMVNQFLTELDSCSNFKGGGFEQFNDGADSGYAVTDALLYWLKQALLNDETSAAIVLLDYEGNGGKFLTTEEITKAQEILKNTIKNPSADNLHWLNQSFSKSKYRTAPVLNWQYIREPRSMTYAPTALNSNIFKCLDDKYVKLLFTYSPIDCAVNVQRYGKWYDPKFSAEIEVEANRVREAWQNGDYAGAGYEALPNILSESSDE